MRSARNGRNGICRSVLSGPPFGGRVRLFVLVWISNSNLEICVRALLLERYLPSTKKNNGWPWHLGTLQIKLSEFPLTDRNGNE